jgi:hypothetical protein
MRTHEIAILALAVLATTAMLRRGTSPAAGTISGKVTYTGTPPKMKPIDMAKEPYCERKHAGAPVVTENVATGPGNALRWVVVYVSAGDQGSAAAINGAASTSPTCSSCSQTSHSTSTTTIPPRTTSTPWPR